MEDALPLEDLLADVGELISSQEFEMFDIHRKDEITRVTEAKIQNIYIVLPPSYKN